MILGFVFVHEVQSKQFRGFQKKIAVFFAFHETHFWGKHLAPIFSKNHVLLHFSFTTFSKFPKYFLKRRIRRHKTLISGAWRPKKWIDPPPPPPAQKEGVVTRLSLTAFRGGVRFSSACEGKGYLFFDTSFWGRGFDLLFSSAKRPKKGFAATEAQL